MTSHVQYGLTLSSEEHPPRRLVEIAELAESTGFDFVSISDHYHPWVDEQGHSPFVWSVLGAIAERTSEISVGVGVTCPIMRIHPAILAQATATTAHLLDGRFVWGVGTGEALNEHILGDRWPPAPLRLEMLEEAVALIRELWSGEQVTFRGQHFTVENARIYDPPPGPVPVIVSAFGPKAAKVAAAIGDGLWVTGPDASGIENWRDEGGSGPVYSQVNVCWSTDREAAIDLAHRVWPNTGVPGQLSQDLPTPTHFEQAAQVVDRDMVASSIPCGPDLEPLVESIRAAIDAGIDHVYVHQVGDDQEGFCRVWRDEVVPELRSSEKDARGAGIAV
jgi:coenzyme F420-dependent glucose-6-phosphate dehydrogenase